MGGFSEIDTCFLSTHTSPFLDLAENEEVRCWVRKVLHRSVTRQVGLPCVQFHVLAQDCAEEESLCSEICEAFASENSAAKEVALALDARSCTPGVSDASVALPPSTGMT